MKGRKSEKEEAIDMRERERERRRRRRRRRRSNRWNRKREKLIK